MQYVNDDMDELLRRAAEEYPLKTDSADWDKVMNKLQSGSNEPSISKKEKDRRRYLFLLLLIPLLVVCTTYINKEFFAGSKLTIGDKEMNGSGKESQKNNASPADTRSDKQIDKKSTNESVNTTSDGRIIKENDVEQKTDVNANTQLVINKTTNDFLSVNKVSNNKKVNLSVAGDPVYQSTKDKRFGPPVKRGVRNGYDQQSTKQNDNIALVPLATTQSDNKPSEIKTNNVAPNVGTKKQNSISATQFNPPNKDSAQQKETTTKTPDKKPKKKETKLYFGLLAGPDYTVVKSTNVHGTGYSFGLLAGYSFSRKIAVETGLLWDRKKYQSEGKYFDTKRVNWPHITVIDIWGYCDMYEIPLNLRYNFSSSSNRTWFANAGISSYLMKQESYDYNYLHYNVPYYGSKEYRNTTNNWFSVAHLSVGLQKKLGKIGDFRVEPYVKLPLNGVGIGSMPLRSGGIYFGVTRPIR